VKKGVVWRNTRRLWPGNSDVHALLLLVFNERAHLSPRRHTPTPHDTRRSRSGCRGHPCCGCRGCPRRGPPTDSTRRRSRGSGNNCAELTLSGPTMDREGTVGWGSRTEWGFGSTFLRRALRPLTHGGVSVASGRPRRTLLSSPSLRT